MAPPGDAVRSSKLIIWITFNRFCVCVRSIEAYSDAFCQILTFENSPGPKIWPLLAVMVALIFLTLDIWRHAGVYGGTWGFMRVYDGIGRCMEVYVGICRNMKVYAGISKYNAFRALPPRRYENGFQNHKYFWGHPRARVTSFVVDIRGTEAIL